MTSLPLFLARKSVHIFWSPSKSLFGKSTAGAATPVSFHSEGSRQSTITALPSATSLAASAGVIFGTSAATSATVVTRSATKWRRGFMGGKGSENRTDNQREVRAHNVTHRWSGLSPSRCRNDDSLIARQLEVM